MTILAILLLGIWFYLRGETTVGDIVMFMSYATLLIGKLEQGVGFANTMVTDAPRLREFFEVLDTVPNVRDRPNAVDPGRLRGQIEFKDVTYSYDGKRPAVQDLNFAAQPGQTIALVGATGAGKSTALALLHRAFDPQSGAIKIDNIDIRDMTLVGLRRNIGVVFQEILLFDRTVAENLRVGKPDATEEEMRAACERAQVLDVIERNPEGFAMVAGERGRMFSGGERQRLSIARALLKDPPILILDEATSALDAVTEAKIQAALDRGDEGPHHLRHRAPAGDHPQRRHHLGVRRRPHHRGRKFRRAGVARRQVCQARPNAIHGDVGGASAIEAMAAVRPRAGPFASGRIPVD